MVHEKDVLKAVQQHRGDAIVIYSAAAGGRWDVFNANEKRNLNLKGAMGHTISAALGVALSLPNEKIFVFDKEGSLLMNLGILATIAEKQPKNFYHFLLDNECYAATGGQPVPNAKNINYAGIAREAGYAAAYNFDDLKSLTGQLGEILSRKGPVLVAIKVVPEIRNEPLGRRKKLWTRGREETVRDLQEELGIA